jgi:hypothetical protein
MSKISFKGKLRSVNEGRVTVLTIPADFIKHGMLWTGQEFKITIDTLEPAGDI